MGQELIMARSILLDTDVLVDFLRGYNKAVAFVNTHSARIILSSVVVAELYAGVKGDAEQAGGAGRRSGRGDPGRVIAPTSSSRRARGLCPHALPQSIFGPMMIRSICS